MTWLSEYFWPFWRLGALDLTCSTTSLLSPNNSPLRRMDSRPSLAVFQTCLFHVPLAECSVLVNEDPEVNIIYSGTNSHPWK